jgi:protein-disulfide isomerase
MGEYMPKAELEISKRRLLGGIAVGAVALALAACSDSKDESAQKSSDPAAAKTDPTETASTDNAAADKKVDVPEAEGTVDVAKLMEPGPLPEESVGKADAPVTIVEYMSMTCPHCARFSNNVFEDIKKKYIDTGKVRFILREFPLDNLAAAAIMLARCAPQEQYFPFVEMLFKQQITWATADDKSAALLQMSKLAGFTQESFQACLTNQKLLDDVTAVKNRAVTEFGVNGTPTFFIDGKRYSGEMSVEQMSALIDPLL